MPDHPRQPIEESYPGSSVVGHLHPPALARKEAQALLVPLPPEQLMAYEVSPQVNPPAYNTPDVLQPVA